MPTSLVSRAYGGVPAKLLRVTHAPGGLDCAYGPHMPPLADIFYQQFGDATTAAEELMNMGYANLQSFRRKTLLGISAIEGTHGTDHALFVAVGSTVVGIVSARPDTQNERLLRSLVHIIGR